MTPPHNHAHLLLGTQYYRPPFPSARYWKEDFEAMASAGLNTVQLWACWGWVEPEPGRYDFDDYDELVEGAADAGLHVVISTIAEIHPFWVHREVPGSEMVDHMGHRVISSLRKECNVGLTPGGCTDHPGVQERMGDFLSAIASHYSSSDALVAWDCWNETRWAVNADGYVCYCQSTLKAFRAWLEGKYGSLDGLCEAWRRRYSSWDDVVPGKQPGLPYTDIVEFEAFLTWRAAQHAAFRAGVIRAADPHHAVVAHCANPAVYSGGQAYEQAVSRGNDFDLAEVLDGFGCSHFPHWFSFGVSDLGARVEAVRSAAAGKPAWVSELQGGGARNGFGVLPPVEPSAQQRWVWGAFGRGVKAVLFWCWRDEVFGSEASGFGLAGSDGGAAGRLRSMARTGELVRGHEELLLEYQPEPAEVGVLFCPATYQLFWADKGNHVANDATDAVRGWLNALERSQVPYDIVDAGRPAGLAGLSLVVLPWALVVPPAMGQALVDWVEAGGTLVVEAELDAYDELGFYRYPTERPLAQALGLTSLGRRPLEDVMKVFLGDDGQAIALRPASWVEAISPDGGEVLSRSGAGDIVGVQRQVGQGRVIAIGSFPGVSYARDRYAGLEQLVGALVELAKITPAFRVTPADGEVLQWRWGMSGSTRLLFLTSEAGPSLVPVLARPGLLGASGRPQPLMGRVFEPHLGPDGWTVFEAELSEDGIAVVAWEQDDAGTGGPR